MARQLVTAVRSGLTAREQLVPVRATDFEDHDARFYDDIGRRFEAAGFRPLGDYADVKVHDAPPERRSFYRLALAGDGTVAAVWFVVPAPPPREPLHCVSLTSWLEDGRTCETTRGSAESGIPLPPQQLLHQADPEATATDLLQAHREAVSAAGGRVKRLATADDILAARDGDVRMIAEFRRQQGLRLFEPMLRHLLGDEYQERGAPLLEAITRHPEWWHGDREPEPATSPPSEAPADEAPHVPEDSFIAAHGESEGLPDIWIVNRALVDLRPQSQFPWHLSIIVECEETTEVGLPTDQENKVLADVGDAFDENLTEAGNAVRLARITWNGTRQYLYRVRDPERANGYLQGVIQGKSPVRQFEFRMESDPAWELAEPYLELGRQKPR